MLFETFENELKSPFFAMSKYLSCDVIAIEFIRSINIELKGHLMI